MLSDDNQAVCAMESEAGREALGASARDMEQESRELKTGTMW